MRVRIYQLICIIIFALPLAANGKTVALSSKSGDLKINGRLLDFDGRYYSIESEYGHVVLDSKLFECAGDGCLGNFGETERLRISALPSLNTLLVPALIDNFARLAAGTIEENREDNQTRYIIRRGSRELRIELQQISDAIAVQNLVEHRSDLAVITRDLTKDEADQQQRNSHQSIWPAPDSPVVALDAYVPTVSRSLGQNSFDVEDIESVGHVALHTPSDFRVLGVEVSEEITLHSKPKTLLGASRLTTTLVLEDDQRTLDPRSNSELVHLYRFLGSDRHDFKEVLVLGLSGASDKNALTETLDLVSEKIGKGLINASGGIKSIQTHSFSNSFPSTCDRNVSNLPRIEIWAR